MPHVDGEVAPGYRDLIVVGAQLTIVLSRSIGRIREVKVSTWMDRGRTKTVIKAMHKKKKLAVCMMYV